MAVGCCSPESWHGSTLLHALLHGKEAGVCVRPTALRWPSLAPESNTMGDTHAYASRLTRDDNCPATEAVSKHTDVVVVGAAHISCVGHLPGLQNVHKGLICIPLLQAGRRSANM